MRKPDGLDLKQLEDDLEALLEKLRGYEGKLLMPWASKAKQALEREILATQWAIVGAKEIVFANQHQVPVYEQAKEQPAPERTEKLARAEELMAERARKLKMKKNMKM
jgi:hypothetical protein